MKASRMTFLAFLISFVVLLANTATGQTPSIDVSGKALNATPIYGPEGIVLTPDGSAYVSDRDGKIQRVTPEGTVEEFADLNTFPGERETKISAIGIAMDKEGDLYVATLTSLDGAVLKVVGPGKPDAGKVTLYRNGVNSANFILIDDETQTMYVSDSSMFSGGVYRFDMSDESLIGTPADQEKELLGKFAYANGLALGPEKKWLYVAETTKGRVSRIDLATNEAKVFVDVGGWADGLLLDSARELIYVCENKGGKIVAVDMSGKVAGAVHLMGKDEQCAPACIVFRDADTVVYTDLWKASLWAALLKRPTHHSYIYQISIAEIVE